MRVIGLTGSIACGKSTISRYLMSRGYPVVDGDQISRELTAPGSPVLEEIRRNFGERYMNENGNLNRRALGQLIFRDEHARSRLDAVMAPHLLKLTEEGIEQYRSEGAELCFLDMPLLYEKGYDRLCDSVWTVWLPENIQLSRLMARDHLSEEDALRRIRSVMSSDEKAARADHVIDNSGSVRQTLEKVECLLHDEINPEKSKGFDSSQHVVSSQKEIDPLPARADRIRVTVSEHEPEVMQRPEAARRLPSERKVAWKLPLWIRIALITGIVLITAGIISCAVMSGYLNRQKQIHEDEKAAIFDHYFVKVSVSYNDYEFRFSDEYKALIIRYAAEYNLNPAFVAAVILNESTFRADVESPVGARGLMQLMPDTAQWIAGKMDIHGFVFDEMNIPEKNIMFGCWYLNWLSKTFGGNLVCVISAYHAGHNQVRNWLSDRTVSRDGKNIELDNLPEGQTKSYARKVVRDYGIYQTLWLSDT